MKKSITFRLSEKELDDLKSKAKNLGLDLSKYIRLKLELKNEDR